MFDNNELNRAAKRARRLVIVVMLFNLTIFVGVFTAILWLIMTLYTMGPQGIGEFFGQIIDAVQRGK